MQLGAAGQRRTRCGRQHARSTGPRPASRGADRDLAEGDSRAPADFVHDRLSQLGRHERLALLDGPGQEVQVPERGQHRVRVAREERLGRGEHAGVSLSLQPARFIACGGAHRNAARIGQLAAQLRGVRAGRRQNEAERRLGRGHRRARKLDQLHAGSAEKAERAAARVVDRHVVRAGRRSPQHDARGGSRPGDRGGDLGIAHPPVLRERHRPRVIREHVGAGLEDTLAAGAPQVRDAGGSPPGAPALAVGLPSEVEPGDEGAFGLRSCGRTAALERQRRARDCARGDDLSAA